MCVEATGPNCPGPGERYREDKCEDRNKGLIAKPKLETSPDKDYLGHVLTAVRDSPNFAGQYTQGADYLSGHAMQPSNLPEEENDSRPISFKLSSELLVVRQCRAGGTAVERRYYRWHRRKWYFLKRGMVPPPPAF